MPDDALRRVLGPTTRRTMLVGLLGGGLAGCAIPNGPTRDFSSSMDGRGPLKVTYGDDPSQFGELSLPEGTPRGVVVLLHGGFWKAAYDLDLARPLARSVVAAGWAAWNLEYRRVGDVSDVSGGGGGVPATLDDVAAGIDRLASVDGIDLARPVIAVGHSAGGHLAVWAGSRGGYRIRVPLTAIVSQAGVLDLTSAYDQDLGDGAVEAFLGHPLGSADASVDPLQQVPLDVPVWCVHGTEDDTVPLAESQAYVAAATAAGATAELVEIEGGDHFVVIDPASEAWKRTLAILDGL